jgi:hypothetical protein
MLATITLALTLSTAFAAPTLSATYVTPTRQGNIAYTAQRGIRGGSEGKFVVDGKSHPGSVYAAVGGGMGMVWYYGTSGNMAGNALFNAQPDGTQSGPIWFFDRSGNIIDSGTATLR